MEESNRTANDPQQKKKNGWWKYGIAGAVLLPKLKAALSLLKLGKVGGTFLSMFATVGAYALVFPWQFAVGLVIMIFIHELGHVIAAKQRGLPVSAPTFIPFIGALITMKRQPLNAETEAFLAYGGPFFGTLGALAAYYLGVWTDSAVLYSIAMIGFFLNLINLLPIHPLDGGRIVTAVSRWFWLLGLIGGLVVIIYTKAIIFLIIWIMFAWDLFEKYGPNRNNKKIQHWPFQLNVAEHVLLNAGLAVPGEAHRRNLPFTTYCDLDSSKQKVAVYWPGVPGRLKTVELPVQQIVQNVTLKGVKRIVNDADADGKAELRLSIDISGTPHKNDRYYEVPAFTRWAYGTAYIGLAVFLSYMYFVVIPPRLEDARRKLEMLSVPF